MQTKILCNRIIGLFTASKFYLTMQTPDGSATISAMPLLEELLADECHTSILTLLRAVPFDQYDNSLVVRRDVRRIPLKLDIATAVDEKESKHLQASYDGLAHFYPVDIYP